LFPFQEIQQLRQHIVQVEQQLRTVLSPTYMPNDREKALQEQQVGRILLSLVILSPAQAR